MSGQDGETEQFAELAELGVTVRDREEFEDGLMRQLDREAAKRNIEQQKKFTEKELVDVRKEINMVGVELSNLDKTITALIKLPLTSIAAKLRSAKAQKELKEKQLQKLKTREVELTTKLLNNKFDDDLQQGDDGDSNNIAFGVAVAPGNKEMADLIQHGHMTPFGGQIIDGVSHDGKGIEFSSNSTIPSNSSIPSNSIIPSDSAIADEKSSDSSLLKSSNLRNTVSYSQIHEEIEIRDEIEIYDENKDDNTDDSSDGSDTAFIPGLDNGDLDYSTSDSYITDDGYNEIRGQGVRVRRYRDIISSESDDDMIHNNKIKRKKVKGKRLSPRRQSHSLAVDDGDDQLYKMRIKEMERDDNSDSLEDMKFNGGLCIPGKIWHRLYKYQRTGVQWLWELHGQQAGGIVGDEMGLGKTIQMIAFLAGLNVSKLYSNVTRCRGLGPVLIVCPATVLYQWVREFHIWWAPFRVVIMHNTGSFQGKKETLISRMAKCNAVVITTYQGVRLYRNTLLRYQWDYVILDEGHKIRNPDADITLTCKQFTTPHKIILSGSPMQNNLKELWSLFDFVFPGKLGTLPVFLEQFSVPITMGGYSTATKIQVQTAYRCACVLRDTISPYLLRRLKADVKLQLPAKNEQVLFCQLTGVQREMYKDFLKSPEVSNILVRRKEIFSGITALRKICNHPDLLGMKEKSQSFSTESCDPDKEGSCDQHGYWDRSGKMIVIVSLLKVWHSLGHRVLLFSQTRKMLDILERLVQSKDYTYLRMDGSTAVGSRQHLINSFNQNSEIFVFLLTTRVGGLGVNLTGADRVVIYDPDWNPSTDTQARERAWRIGQNKQVTIYRLITTGTIEEKIYHRQIFKQFLTNRILRDPRQRRLFKTNDLYDLFTLGSGDSSGSETGALFAGTGSQVKILPKNKNPSKEKSKRKSNDTSSCASLSSRQSCDPSNNSGGSNESSCDPSNSSSSSKSSCDPSKSSCDPSKSPCDPDGSSKGGGKLKSLEEIRKAWQVELFGDASTKSKSSHAFSASHDADKTDHKSRKRKHSCAFIDGSAIAGLERTAVYEEPEAEKEKNKEENDSVLKMLMQKTGLHSAFHHDNMVNGGDPDYVLLESEADQVAQSAARVLLQSRLQCNEDSRWGLPTWTGQNGIAGRPSNQPLPRFGSAEKAPIISTDATATAHFGGDQLRCSQEGAGSANISSAILLQKIHQRNAHKSGGKVSVDPSKVEQLREIRDFVACQCKKDGQATTAELIERFSGTAHEQTQSTFRSMLKEICEFYREHGTGIWRLKPEYRY